MTSPAQIIANQRNAQQSTGPRTPDGKAAVARNSTMHGLAGSHIVLPGEDAAHFDALLETLRNEHSPSGATEDFLIQQMAQSQWKLQRAALIEQQILSVAMGEPMQDNASSRLAHIFLDGSSAAKALDRLARYEAAARRLWFQSLKQFTDLRRASSVQKASDVRGRQRHQNLFIDKAIEEFCRPFPPCAPTQCRITEQTQFQAPGRHETPPDSPPSGPGLGHCWSGSVGGSPSL